MMSDEPKGFDEWWESHSVSVGKLHSTKRFAVAAWNQALRTASDAFFDEEVPHYGIMKKLEVEEEA